MERWIQIRLLARRARAAVDQIAESAQARDVVQAAVRAAGLIIVSVPADDPLLGGARSALLGDMGLIAIDAELPEEMQWFAVAHEVGHHDLHGRGFHCAPSDVEDAPTTSQSPMGEGAVETYNPRQRRETEANVFAAEFLMPGPVLRQHFLLGGRLSTLATQLGVSEMALLNQLVASLLAAPDSAVPITTAMAVRPTLDLSQQAAAFVRSGPLLVDAGPGTGKTRTLIGRILFLIEEQGVSPERILALTFSNKAAREMRERLAAVVPLQAHAITIGTFHAFCLDVLRRHTSQARLPPEVHIIDAVDAAIMLEQRLAQLRLVEYGNLYEPGRYIKDILRAISRAKDELVGPDGYAALADAMLANAGTDDERRAAARAAEVARIYRFYEEMLAEHGLVDFGDLLVKAVDLITEHPEVCAHLQATYTHVLVDEYQDVNRASAMLLRLLAGDGQGLWAVGDLRQSIYRFRGASPANIGRFEDDFPGGERTSLEVNYRSLGPIVRLLQSAAQAVPVPSPAVPPWRAERGDGDGRSSIVRWAETTSADAEAEGIASTIRTQHDAGCSYADQAILCATHGQAADMAAALETRAIPVAYIGDLFERVEVKDLLAILALAAEADGATLIRIAHFIDHPLSSDDVAALREGARAAGHLFPSALLHAAEYANLSPEGTATAIALGQRLAAISYGRDAWDCLARYLFAESNYVAHLLRADTVQTQQGLLALGQLLLLARGFATRPLRSNGGEAKRDFLRYVRHLIATQDARMSVLPDSDEVDAVRLLTVHASKGLEFRVVFVPNLAMQRFPPQKPWDPAPPPVGLLTDAGPDVERVEETCLFFVALSRARDLLVLSRATKYGKVNRRPSLLWPIIEQHQQRLGLALEQWGTATPGREQSVPSPAMPRTAEKIVLPISQVELYLDCPRKYYYRYVLGIAERDEKLGYKRFHDCVRRTAAWVRDRRIQDANAIDWQEVVAELDTEWSANGPINHVHEGYYRTTAEEMLHRLWSEIVAAPPAVLWHQEVVVELADCLLTVRFDRSERDNSGIRLVRYRTGKVDDDHRKEPRLALYRAAANQHADGIPATIEILYLADGTRVEVRDQGRYEQDRLNKLNNAARLIQNGEFPPAPTESGLCVRCPFSLICPS